MAVGEKANESIPHPAVDPATKQDLALLGAELRAEMQAQFRAQTWRLVGAVAVIVGVAEAISRMG